MKKLLSLGAVLCLISASIFAQTISAPQVQLIQPTDLFQDIVGGLPQASSYYVSSGLIGNYGATLNGNNPENALIGGDATVNLFQRGTTGASVTTTVTYGGPDRFAYWSGTNTAMTVSQDSTAGDLTTGHRYAFKMARTAAQTGVVPVCMAQVVESANSYQFAGQTAELDFVAVAGSNFSAASGLTAYIVYGTGVDEGMTKLAYGLNGGGGGSTGWTGQANAVAGAVPLAASASGRFTVAGTVPSTATEVAAVICYTPVGTAGTNDYVALNDIQLVRNTALAPYLAATSGVFPVNDSRAKAYARRSLAQEALLQQRYYFQLTETSTIQSRGSCAATTTTVAQCVIQYPVPLRVAPTASFTAGFAVPTTTAGTTLGACTGLALSPTITGNAAGVTSTAVACTATTVPAAGSALAIYDNSGSGAMKFNAEL